MFCNHFQLKEFFVGCTPAERASALTNTEVVNNILYWVSFLEKLRSDLCSIKNEDTPIIITSCYRDKAHNARTVGSSSTSQHLNAGAVDIKTKDINDIEHIKYAVEMFYPYGQLIIYNTFVHISVIRDDKSNFITLDKRS